MLWYISMVKYYMYIFIIVIMRILSARLSACTARPSPGRRWTWYYNDIILVFYISVLCCPSIFTPRLTLWILWTWARRKKIRFDMFRWEIANLPTNTSYYYCDTILPSWRSNHHECNAARRRQSISYHNTNTTIVYVYIYILLDYIYIIQLYCSYTIGYWSCQNILSGTPWIFQTAKFSV